MKKEKKLLLFWLPLIGLTAAGTALWPMVFTARFPEGQALHFVVGPLWGWMGLAQLMGFFPRREDRPPEPLPVRLFLGLASPEEVRERLRENMSEAELAIEDAKEIENAKEDEA